MIDLKKHWNLGIVISFPAIMTLGAAAIGYAMNRPLPGVDSWCKERLTSSRETPDVAIYSLETNELLFRATDDRRLSQLDETLSILSHYVWQVSVNTDENGAKYCELFSYEIELERPWRINMASSSSDSPNPPEPL